MNEQAISIEELEQAFSLVLQGLRRRSSPIPISDDYYWLLLEEEERYDVYSDPKNFGIGQLSDDLYFLRSALADTDGVSELYLLSKLLPILGNIVDRNFG